MAKKNLYEDWLATRDTTQIRELLLHKRAKQETAYLYSKANPDRLLSPWLVRHLCEECATEHYRHYDKSQREETFIVLGQCKDCFDATTVTMLALGMIDEEIPQFSQWGTYTEPRCYFDVPPSWLRERVKLRNYTQTTRFEIEWLKKKETK